MTMGLVDDNLLWQLAALGVIGIAALLGGVVGFERSLAAKAAGTRTHMLVAASAAMLILLGRVAIEGSSTGLGDGTRTLHAVITGIGFLGGGAIIRDTVKGRTGGLTTAATVFFVAAVGAACGFGQLVLAVGATAIAILTLRGVRGLEIRFGARSSIDNSDSDEV